jgi:hypothetical protein
MKQYDRWRHLDHYNDTPEWLETRLLTGMFTIGPLNHIIMDGIALIEAFLPIGRTHYDVIYLIRRMYNHGHFFQL